MLRFWLLEQTTDMYSSRVEKSSSFERSFLSIMPQIITLLNRIYYWNYYKTIILVRYTSGIWIISIIINHTQDEQVCKLDYLDVINEGKEEERTFGCRPQPLGLFTFWITFSLSPKFGLRPKISQIVQSFFLWSQRIAQLRSERSLNTKLISAIG